MADIGPIPPAEPGPPIRPKHVPAEERDKHRRPDTTEPDEEQGEQQPAEDESRDEKRPSPDDKDEGPHIDVFV